MNEWSINVERQNSEFCNGQEQKQRWKENISYQVLEIGISNKPNFEIRKYGSRHTMQVLAHLYFTNFEMVLEWSDESNETFLNQPERVYNSKL